MPRVTHIRRELASGDRLVRLHRRAGASGEPAGRKVRCYTPADAWPAELTDRELTRLQAMAGRPVR